MPGIFVQIAAYNELDNLKRLVPQLLEMAGEYQVLVIDDNSPDGSGAWLEQLRAEQPRLHLIRRPGKLGYGSATIDGFRYVIGQGGERVITMDADFSHDPCEIPAMIQALDTAEMVLGSRYVGGCRILNWGIRRLIVSVFANFYVRTLLRLPYTDCTSGYRGYRTQTLRDRARLERLKSEGYSMLVEILYQIHRSGARIAEHPIIYHERREGMSKMSNKVILESIVNPFRFWFKIGFPAGGGGRAHKS